MYDTIYKNKQGRIMLDKVLKAFGYSSVKELIYNTKIRASVSYVTTIDELTNLPDKITVTVFGYIDNFKIQPLNDRISKIVASLYKDGKSVKLEWIVAKNSASKLLYVLQNKNQPNQLMQVTGKLKLYEATAVTTLVYITNAEIVPTTNGFVYEQPVYSLTKDIKHYHIQEAFKEVVESLNEIQKQESFMPEELEKELNLPDLKTSLEVLHGLKPLPLNTDYNTKYLYKRRVLIEKIWEIMQKHNTKHEEKPSDIQILPEDIQNIKHLIDRLPFELTSDQKKATWAILQRFQEHQATKNLVFGDVGSGKTIVAQIIAYVLMKKGYQVAIIAPTSILARQHYENAVQLFNTKNLFLVDSKTSLKSKKSIQKVLDNKEPAILYGTTALNNFKYTNLKLVVVDEEQKFGVKDKEFLYDTYEPHLVYMTATPIPRTLAHSFFSHFKIYKIEEKPSIQKPRITKIQRLEDMPINEINEIKKRMRVNKEQTLVIVPSILSDEMINIKDTKAKYKKFFPEFKIESIHGQLTSDRIEQTIKRFLNKKIDILIATTMVDVGFSSESLSHVFIENAERFGISQLHQIRGRVGRGKYQGYCYISPKNMNLKPKTKERLESLTKSENGFELAVKDVNMRGTGDLLGTEQSGGEDVNLIEWLNEIQVMRKFLQKEKEC